MRDLGLSCVPDCDTSDARDVFFASDDAVAPTGGLTTGLLGCVVGIFFNGAFEVMLVRLEDWWSPSVAFAAEALVAAIAAAGKRVGRVGERGRGLLLGGVGVGVASFLTPLLVGISAVDAVLLSRVDFVDTGGTCARAALVCACNFGVVVVVFLDVADASNCFVGPLGSGFRAKTGVF